MRRNLKEPLKMHYFMVRFEIIHRFESRLGMIFLLFFFEELYFFIKNKEFSLSFYSFKRKNEITSKLISNFCILKKKFDKVLLVYFFFKFYNKKKYLKMSFEVTYSTYSIMVWNLKEPLKNHHFTLFKLYISLKLY